MRAQYTDAEADHFLVVLRHVAPAHTQTHTHAHTRMVGNAGSRQALPRRRWCNTGAVHGLSGEIEGAVPSHPAMPVDEPRLPLAGPRGADGGACGLRHVARVNHAVVQHSLRGSKQLVQRKVWGVDCIGLSLQSRTQPAGGDSIAKQVGAHQERTRERSQALWGGRAERATEARVCGVVAGTGA